MTDKENSHIVKAPEYCLTKAKVRIRIWGELRRIRTLDFSLDKVALKLLAILYKELISSFLRRFLKFD